MRSCVVRGEHFALVMVCKNTARVVNCTCASCSICVSVRLCVMSVRPSLRLDWTGCLSVRPAGLDWTRCVIVADVFDYVAQVCAGLVLLFLSDLWIW